MLTLHNLEKPKSSDKRRVRRGRGNASGSGNYSGRGMKGQRSRSGGKSGLALRSIKSYLLRIPKTRGFKSLNKKMATVNVYDLEKYFKDGDIVNARDLLRLNLISTISNGLKILSDGKLSKKLTVEANAFSAKAKEKIEKAGGQAKIIQKSESSKVKKSVKDEKVAANKEDK
ncbi:50S ribosomal protein L15 [bacterium]|nr:50S ribosomal protein L15 [bacterium]